MNTIFGMVLNTRLMTDVFISDKVSEKQTAGLKST